MLKRLIKLIVGIILVGTLPFTIIPFLLIWVITGQFYINNIVGWILSMDL